MGLAFILRQIYLPRQIQCHVQTSLLVRPHPIKSVFGDRQAPILSAHDLDQLSDSQNSKFQFYARQVEYIGKRHLKSHAGTAFDMFDITGGRHQIQQINNIQRGWHPKGNMMQTRPVPLVKAMSCTPLRCIQAAITAYYHHLQYIL